jgi:hypothetical protein
MEPSAIFTMMQLSRFLIAPNATVDGMTGYKRDGPVQPGTQMPIAEREAFE